MISENIVRVKDYVNTSKLPDSDYVINPYTGCTHKCLYCYAEFMGRFTNHQEPWGDFIDVKLCKKAVNSFKLEGKKVLLSSVTDPYNPFEAKHETTKRILEQLIDANIELSIATKSDLILRDIELLKQFKNIEIAFSVCTLSEDFRKEIEPCAPSIEKRLNAIKTIHENGLKTSLFISPIFPEITDYKAIVNQTKDYVDTFWFENLNLRGSYKSKVLEYIYNNYPHLKDLYNQIYKKNDTSYWQTMEDDIKSFCTENNINYRNYFYHEKIRKSS